MWTIKQLDNVKVIIKQNIITELFKKIVSIYS